MGHSLPMSIFAKRTAFPAGGNLSQGQLHSIEGTAWPCEGSAMPDFNPVFSALPTTIFTHMSALAVEHKAINLGQGFPDEDGPLAVREAAARALIEGPNQYPPMKGRVELRHAIAGHA